MKKFIKILMVFTLIFSLVGPVSAEANKAEAAKSSQKIILDEKEVELPAYMINEKNYIKLRDFAAILNESANKFSITYNKEKNAILIKTGEGYEKVADDLKEVEDEKSDAILSEIEIMVNDKVVKVNSAKIKGYNYLQIKEASDLLGLEISFNEETKVLEIKTMADPAEKEMKCEKEGCMCKHKSKEEVKSCPCCSDKKMDAKEESSNTELKDGEYYACSPKCKCRHKTMEEYNNCKCCKGKPAQKFTEDQKKDDSKKEMDKDMDKEMGHNM